MIPMKRFSKFDSRRKSAKKPAGSLPDCKSFDCPVLAMTDAANTDKAGKVKVPYCGMHQRYLEERKDGTVKPCAQCFRDRGSHWRR